MFNGQLIISIDTGERGVIVNARPMRGFVDVKFSGHVQRVAVYTVVSVLCDWCGLEDASANGLCRECGKLVRNPSRWENYVKEMCHVQKP